MQLNRAAKSIVEYRAKSGTTQGITRAIDANRSRRHRETAEALYEFVFSGCDRLDGKHHWGHCNEETKEEFRLEASAVLEAVWPILSPRELKSQIIRQRANWSRLLGNYSLSVWAQRSFICSLRSRRRIRRRQFSEIWTRPYSSLGTVLQSKLPQNRLHMHLHR